MRSFRRLMRYFPLPTAVTIIAHVLFIIWLTFLFATVLIFCRRTFDVPVPSCAATMQAIASHLFVVSAGFFRLTVPANL